MQTMTLDYSLTPYTKMKFKSIEDLNVRPEIMKLLEKSTRRKFLDIALEDDFVVVVVVVVLQLSQFPPIALPCLADPLLSHPFSALFSMSMDKGF